jgi:hypothetical protein
MHRYQQFAMFDERGDLNSGWWVRKLCRVSDNLTEGLLDQDRINMDERQITAQTQLNKAAWIAKPDTFNRGIYNPSNRAGNAILGS